ncbi:hypothetical protein ACLK1T_04045 [Escherichia coli]
MPPAVAGDVYLTGIQLAQGYLGRPNMTAAALLPNPLPRVNGCAVPETLPAGWITAGGVPREQWWIS